MVKQEVIGNPIDFPRLVAKIHQLFNSPDTNEYFYKIAPLEVAMLQFRNECQKQGLIWAVRLPDEIFAARKQVPLDLAVLFDRNLLFSQFSRGRMLRLLPTNQ